MKVAVLGANGFVGGRMVEKFHLLDQGIEVRPVVRSYSSLARLSRFDLDCPIADARDCEALHKAFTGCEVVVHSVVGDPEMILSTLAPVYQAAQQAGVRRLVYLSTASVHGQAPAPGTDEHSPLRTNQRLIYNNAKVKAERRLLKLRRAGRVELVMLRPGIVFGPRSRWVAGLAEELLEGRAYLLAEGQGICNSIYIDNLVEAVRLSLDAHEADGLAFLVGDRETVTWRDFYRPFAEALGIDPAQIPRLPTPTFSPGLRDRLEGVRVSKPVQAVMPLFPTPLKQAVKGAIGGWSEGPLPSAWFLRKPVVPVVTEEMALLHSCAYKLPSTRAEKVLGFEPPVSFVEGCRRSVGWLAFAGYPVGSP